MTNEAMVGVVFLAVLLLEVLAFCFAVLAAEAIIDCYFMAKERFINKLGDEASAKFQSHVH